MSSIAEAHGGSMSGLQFAVKQRDDVADKIGREAEEKGLSEQEAAEKDLIDTNRYTMTFPAENYTSSVQRAVSDMKAAGYQPTKASNTWDNGNVYQGLNTQWKDPQGQRFEMQFHTPESFDTKMGQHDLYKASRGLPNGHPDRLSANEQMGAMSAALSTPEGATTLGIS